MHALLAEAGFLDAHPTAAADAGGVHVRPDPDGGVEVLWDPGTHDAAVIAGAVSRYPGIRTAVHLAVVSVLTGAGYRAVCEPGAARVRVLPA